MQKSELQHFRPWGSNTMLQDNEAQGLLVASLQDINEEVRAEAATLW